MLQVVLDVGAGSGRVACMFIYIYSYSFYFELPNDGVANVEISAIGLQSRMIYGANFRIFIHTLHMYRPSPSAEMYLPTECQHRKDNVYLCFNKILQNNYVFGYWAV